MRNRYGWDTPRSTESINEPIPIWHNPRTNETIQISGNGDAFTYYVRKSLPLPSALALEGGMASTRISPVWIDLNRNPVGELAKSIRAREMGLPDWQRGNFYDAERYAVNYMRLNPGWV